MSICLQTLGTASNTDFTSVIEENAIDALTCKLDSRWHNFLLQLMNPLRVRLQYVERLLLTVAFGNELEAKQCWNRLSTSEVPLEDLDASNYSTFPYVTRRLAEIAPNDRYREKLKGHYKYTWTNNQLKFRELANAVTALKANGIPCIIVGDTGVSLASQSAFGLGQLDALILLVAPDNYVRAQALLRATPVLLIKRLHRGMESQVWERSTPVEISGVQAPLLSAGDLFFQHLLSVKFERKAQREWFAGCVRLLALLDCESQLERFLERVNTTGSALDVLHSWCLFLRIAELTHCQNSESAVYRAISKLSISPKELLDRCGRRLRFTISSMRGRHGS